MPRLILLTLLALGILAASIFARPAVMCEPPLTLPSINWGTT